MPKNVIVVGMPRSGTSMVAGIFARKGYFVAEDPERELRDGDHHNPFGYWEAETLTRLNEAVFHAAGFEENNTWLGGEIPPEAVERIPRIAALPGHVEWARSYDEHAPWVWKDPRLCYTLGYWWPLIDADNTCVLLTNRSPEAILQSFLRLHWRDSTAEAREDVLRRIRGHAAAARATVERLSIPHVEVMYESFADDPEGMAERLSDLADLPLTAADLGFAPKLDHSSLRGRLATWLDHGAERMPGGMRRLAKRLVPKALMRTLFPERTIDAD